MSLPRTLAVVCLLVPIAACGSEGEQNTVREPQPEPCPPLTDDVDSSATFTWMYSVDNTSFDPDHITTNNSLMYLFPIYDPLVHIDEHGEPQPMLAESWEASDDGDTLEMTLVDDWEYHDGTPFDADSVVANIERSKQEGSFNENALRIVDDVAAEDDSTVRFETDSSAGALVGVLGGAAGMMMSPEVMDDTGQDVQPTGGSGAYELADFVSGSQAEYTAVDDYWDADNQNVDHMVYKISGDDNARLNAVSTGSADATFLRASMYQPAKEEGLVLCEQPSLSAYNMDLNTDRAEFDQPEVRAALNHAIDRESVAALTNGFCQPGVQMFPSWYFAANDDITPESYEYDPEKAERLLEEAGLPDGFSFELRVVNLDLYQQIAEVVQANYAEVGIDVTITPMELDALSESFSVEQNADAALSEQKAESDPSTLTSDYYRQDGFNNPGGWGSDTITELNQEAMSGATAEERAPAFDELFTAVNEEVPPHVTLCHLTTPFAMNDQVKGVDIYADGTRKFPGVGMETGN